MAPLDTTQDKHSALIDLTIGSKQTKQKTNKKPQSYEELQFMWLSGPLLLFSYDIL